MFRPDPVPPVPRLPVGFRSLFPGLLLSATIAACAMTLADMDGLRAHGVGALTLAIVVGMLVGNFMSGPQHALAAPGIDLSRQRLLRLGVVLYGMRLTLQDIAQVGIAGLLVDASVVVSTFLLACVIGIRWLRLDRETAVLIGAGSSICGAAAVLATEPVLRARSGPVAVAIATVVLFGSIAIFLYPALYALNQTLGFVPGGERGFGVYAGSTIHEVAQVVAAGRSIGAQAADTAVITKMVRVMMLAPFLLGLAFWLSRGRGPAPTRGARPALPWFALAFVAVVLFNSLHRVPAAVAEVIDTIDTVILTMAMAALGIATRVRVIRQAGIKPLLLAAALFAWLVVGGAVINRWLVHWFAA